MRLTKMAAAVPTRSAVSSENSDSDDYIIGVNLTSLDGGSVQLNLTREEYRLLQNGDDAYRQQVYDTALQAVSAGVTLQVVPGDQPSAVLESPAIATPSLGEATEPNMSAAVGTNARAYVPWTRARTPNQRRIDREASTHLLDLVYKHRAELGDNKTKKKGVYETIADTLVEEHGYIGLTGTACYEKTRRLEKVLKKYVDDSKKTGTSPPDKPDNLDLLEKVFGSHHHIRPTCLKDSLTTENNTQEQQQEQPRGDDRHEQEEEEDSGEGPSQPKKQKTKYKSRSTEVITFLQESRQQEEQERREILQQMKELNQTIKESDRRREEKDKEMLDFFKAQQESRMAFQREFLSVMKDALKK